MRIFEYFCDGKRIRNVKEVFLIKENINKFIFNNLFDNVGKI